MRRLLWRGGSDQGFSLVEVLAAMSVFGIITLGTVPLVLTSLKGAALSRSYTVGKNLAVQAMERARGLPYYVDFPTQKAYASDTGAPRKVDLLDMYYPSYDASGVFTTTCTDSVADRQRPECPKEVPPNYTVVFKARFVSAVASGSSETYQTKVAPGSYAWNPSTYSGQDRPPTQLVELTVTASWQMRDATRSFSLKGLIGDRPYGKVTVDGAANLNYLVRATTVLVDASGGRRRVVGTAGMSESGVQTKTISSADQTVRAAQLQLFDVPSDPSLQGTLLEEQAGASAGYHAAPDVVSTSLSASARTLTDSSLGTVGGMDETSITGGKYVRVDGELPLAQGELRFQTPSDEQGMLWLAAPAGSNPLQLDTSAEVLSFRARAGKTLTGATSSEARAVTAPDRGVYSQVSASFGRLRLLPTDFISAPIAEASGGSITEHAVVVLDDFSSGAQCKATAATSGVNAAAAGETWSARLYYYADDDSSDNIAAGRYKSIDLSSTKTVDELAAKMNAGNPVVYDAPAGGQDLYLFDRPPAQPGYLESWLSVIGNFGTVDSTGRVTAAALDGAIRIETAPLNPVSADSKISLQVGGLSCRAVDKR